MNKPDPRANDRVIDLSAARASLMGIDLWRSLNEDWIEAPEPAPHPMLVRNLLPSAKGGLLAGMGKVGKTTAIDDLMFKLAYPKARETCRENPNLLTEPDTWMGEPLDARGAKVIVISKESSREDMTRQAHRLDVQKRRKDWRRRNGDQQRIAFMPSSLSTVLMQSTPTGLMRLDAMKHLEDFAHEFFDGQPGLIVLDTLSKLFRINFDSSTSDTAGVADEMDMMAGRTGATVLGLYHTSKSKDAFKSQEEMRAGIKGSAGLVDGVRFALGMWKPWDDLLQAVLDCRLAGKPSQVVMAGVVAHNVYEMNEAAELPRIMVRSGTRFGEMNDVTASLRNAIGSENAELLLRGKPLPKEKPAKGEAPLDADGAPVKRGRGRPRKDA